MSTELSTQADLQRRPSRIVILGGGFAGVYTASHLERLWRGNPSAVAVTLISRTNYFLMTPLLFEAGSGVLEPRHAVNPIRQMFTHARFMQAEIERIDIERRTVHVRALDDEVQQVEYDHLVLALGGVTNTRLIPGSEHAITFKTLADAIHLRNHTIQRFERADVETEPAQIQRQLSFVIIGAGLVGVELMGELTDFVHHVARVYPRVDRSLIRFELIEGASRIIPEFDEPSATYATEVLRRRGVRVHVNTRVKSIQPGRVELDNGETIASETVVVATGVIPNPLLADLPLAKDRRGKIQTEGTMRVVDRQDVWALGDSASIPDPTGKPYPPLAQHAIREARTLAENITSAIHDRPLQPFVYETQGSLASLGHFRGVGKVWGIRVKGFVAWWIWRTYYLFRMPRWERRLRIMIDWAIALFFKNDVVQLDLDRREMHDRA